MSHNQKSKNSSVIGRGYIVARTFDPPAVGEILPRIQGTKNFGYLASGRTQNERSCTLPKRGGAVASSKPADRRNEFQKPNGLPVAARMRVSTSIGERGSSILKR